MPRAPKAQGHADPRKPWRARTASSSVVRSRAWRALRAQALERDGHQCVCIMDGARCPAVAVEVDHVIPVHKGGMSVLDNLASLCAPHHREKTQREAAEASRRASTPSPLAQAE